MFCPKCGTQVAETAAFCPKCGQAMKQNNTWNVVNTVETETQPVKEARMSKYFYTYLKKWKESINNKCKDRASLVWVLVHVLAVFVLCLLLFWNKEEPTIRYVNSFNDRVTAYLVGPFEYGMVEIPQYVEVKGRTYQIDQIALYEEHMLSGSSLTLVEGERQNGTIEELSIDTEVMAYIQEINLPHYFLSFEDCSNSTMKKITADTIVLQGGCPSLQEIVSDTQIEVHGEYPVLDTVNCSGTVFLEGTYESLETIYCDEDMKLEGEFPVLANVDIEGELLVLGGNFASLESVSIDGKVDIQTIMSGSKEYTYPVLKKLEGNLVIIEVRTSMDYFGVMYNASSSEQYRLAYNEIKESMPMLKNITMHVSSEEFFEKMREVEGFGDSEGFYEYLFERIDVTWD